MERQKKLMGQPDSLFRRAVIVFIKTVKANRGKKEKKLGKPESWDSQRAKIRLAVKVFIEAWKRGQVRLLLNLIITGMEMKLSWDEQVGRLTGEIYAEQIKNAVEEYKAKHPENFQTKVKINGYDKYLEATREVNK